MIDALKKILNLDDEKKRLDARIKEIRAERAVLEETLMNEFAENGINQMKVDGKTVYLTRELWASPKDKDQSFNYLKLIGLGDYVAETVNSNSISAFVREMEKSQEPLPDGFEDHFRVSEVFKIKTRRS